MAWPTRTMSSSDVVVAKESPLLGAGYMTYDESSVSVTGMSDASSGVFDSTSEPNDSADNDDDFPDLANNLFFLSSCNNVRFKYSFRVLSQ